MSNSLITTTGFVASDPIFFDKNTQKNDFASKDFASFRFGSSPRYYDEKSKSWLDGNTTWYDIQTFGSLAKNVVESISKGDPIIVSGLIRTRIWEDQEGRERTNLVIKADSIGHDLVFGQTKFSRNSNEGKTPF
ncbi:MAG: single-stranded DNA-binding protein [Candidatus Ancillula sp.]|jgi:single-strand DNA-binding protein|nr:single-stranded DNA-binding protein [Candidatus Ancillula sp.]